MDVVVKVSNAPSCAVLLCCTLNRDKKSENVIIIKSDDVMKQKWITTKWKRWIRSKRAPQTGWINEGEFIQNDGEIKAESDDKMEESNDTETAFEAVESVDVDEQSESKQTVKKSIKINDDNFTEQNSSKRWRSKRKILSKIPLILC